MRSRMRTTTSTTSTPFQSITDACRTTGLSMYFLREGCRSGEVPHVRSGKKYLVNVPALLRKLDAEMGKESA